MLIFNFRSWRPIPPEAPEESRNKNRLDGEELQKTASAFLREEDGDKALAMTLTEEVKELRPPKGGNGERIRQS